MDEFLDVISGLLDKKVSSLLPKFSYLEYKKTYGKIIFLFSFSGKDFYIELTRKSASPNCKQTKLFNISVSRLEFDECIEPLLILFENIVKKVEEKLSDKSKSNIMEFFPKKDIFSLDKEASVKNIITTKRCNVRCVFCKNCEDDYSEVPSKYYLKSSIQSIRAEHSGIGFDGGEPTTHPDFLELIKYSKELGFNSISIVTNGIKLSDPNFLHDIYEAGVSHINFSFSAHFPELSTKIYGRDISGMQLKALDNIAKMRTLFHLTTQIIIVKENQRYLHEMIEHLLTINPDNLTLINPFDPFFGQKSWSHLPDINKIDLERHLERLEKAMFTTFKIRHFPICKVPERFRKYMEVVKYGNNSFTKADVCKPCARMRECYFSSKAYLKTYPEQELVPFLEK